VSWKVEFKSKIKIIPVMYYNLTPLPPLLKERGSG